MSLEFGVATHDAQGKVRNCWWTMEWNIACATRPPVSWGLSPRKSALLREPSHSVDGQNPPPVTQLVGSLVGYHVSHYRRWFLILSIMSSSVVLNFSFLGNMYIRIHSYYIILLHGNFSIVALIIRNHAKLCLQLNVSCCISPKSLGPSIFTHFPPCFAWPCFENYYVSPSEGTLKIILYNNMFLPLVNHVGWSMCFIKRFYHHFMVRVHPQSLLQLDLGGASVLKKAMSFQLKSDLQTWTHKYWFWFQDVFQGGYVI